MYVVVLFSRHTAKLYSNTAFVYGFTAIPYSNTENYTEIQKIHTAIQLFYTAIQQSYTAFRAVGSVGKKESPGTAGVFLFRGVYLYALFPLEGSCFLCPPCPLGSLALDIPVIEKLDIEYTRVFAAFELVEIYKRLYKVSSRRYVLVA